MASSPVTSADDPVEGTQPGQPWRMEPEGFSSRVTVTDGCWLWTGRRNVKGYGQYNPRHGVHWLAHRYAWTRANGPIPNGLMVCHHCDVPACVNPAHLFLGTATDNMQDAKRKGRLRSLMGEANPRAKLTVSAVRTIRELAGHGLGYRRLSRQFGIGHSQMKRVLNGSDWTWLPADGPSIGSDVPGGGAI